MKKLISEFSKHTWHLDENRYKSILDISTKLNYKNDKYKTKRHTADQIIDEIKNTLKGNDINRLDQDKLENNYALKYYTYGRDEDKDIYIIIKMIIFLGCRSNSYTNNIKSWLHVRSLLEAYINLKINNFSINEDLDNDKKSISESIKYLMKRNFLVTISNGDILIDKSTEKKILESLQYRISKLGSMAILGVINNINQHYDYSLGRYLLRPEPSISLNYKPSIPWGYLFNISLPYFYKRKKNIKSKRQFNELVELSKHYFSIKQLQETSKFQDIGLDSSSILHAIQRNISFDQYFLLDQISTTNFNKMLRGMFSLDDIVLDGLNISIYFDILDCVSSFDIKNEYPLFFNLVKLKSWLNYKYNDIELSEALNNLSMPLNSVNKGYIIPSDIEKKNYYKKPFLLKDNEYIYINPILCSYGFYFSLEKILLDYGYNRGILGILAEKFLAHTFKSKNIKFHSGKKYIISRDLNISSQEGECDFIIETQDTIIFIELKRKTLTVNSRKGDVLQSTVDLSNSFLHALSQTGRHELVLRKQKFINFKDGTTIKLNGRDIDKISLSLFDFNSMHDSMFIQKAVSILINGEIKSDNLKYDKEINKNLKNIRGQYTSDEFKKEYIDTKIFFMGCQFYSVPQFLDILKYCNNNKEFKEEIHRTKQLSTGCKDWYIDYKHARKLAQYKKI